MLEIVDSHFHIWDLDVLKLPWLDSCPAIKRSYGMDELCKAYGRQEVDFKGGVYVEVDCDDVLREDAYIFGLHHPKILARSLRAPHICRQMRLPAGIAGVREPLHVDSSPRGRCLEQSFIEGLETLAADDLLFESCNRTEELSDLYKTLLQVPQVKTVINHCGNVTALTAEYRETMKKLAKLPNVYCKVSGFPTADKAFVKELLDFLVDSFEPSHLIYASNFPVVGLYASFDEHLRILREYFADDADFFGKNAKKLYKINKPQVFASVIRLRPEKAAYYKKLHADPYSGVNRMIRECGITKYQIFNRGELLFSVMEYAGDDYAYDMARMARDPETQRWWRETDPCQVRIDGAAKEEWWADMQLVYDLNKKMEKEGN
jgi:L-fuconolactonase